MNIINLPCYKNDKGEIQMILESCQVGSISRIHTTANNFRARHWHKNDEHTIFINYGLMEIYELPVGSNEKPLKFTLKRGDIHLTKKNIIHEMWFLEDTSFDCYSLLPRDQANYENETVRVDFCLKDIYDKCN